MIIEIVPLQAGHKSAWMKLAAGYKHFYETPTTTEEYEAAWARILASDQVIGIGAMIEGELVGFAHFLFHASVWAPTVCYLQDLFTAQGVRGHGVASALIKAIAERAKEKGAKRYYWLTKADNKTARSLYEKFALHHGFIRYDFPMISGG
jgi:GNAT superfamily N-acetyltransferase